MKVGDKVKIKDIYGIPKFFRGKIGEIFEVTFETHDVIIKFSDYQVFLVEYPTKWCNFSEDELEIVE
jgi:hypothetical protein